MIRSFSKNGLVQRSIVSCQRSQYNSLKYGIFDPNFGRGHVFASYRLVSTSPEHPLPKSAPSPVSQLPPATPRKHKVELRPSPVKPPLNKSTSNEHPLKPTSATSIIEPQPKEGDMFSRSSASGSNSMLKSTKQDYEEAGKHGILVPPPPNTSRVKQLWHQAKEIFKFYIRGIKLINTHRKRVKAIEARVMSGGEPLTRWEARFIETYRIDVKKLIPFLLILVIIEEIIPLVVLYAPFMLPSTCVLPSQRERILLKQRETIQMYSNSMKQDFRQILKRRAAAPPIPLDRLVIGTERLAMCGVLSLSTFGPPPIRLNRIKRHLQRISEDDAFLNREGMDQRLTLPELQEALDERGFGTNGLEREDMQARLRWWLTSVEEDFVSEDSSSKRALLIASIHSGDAEKRW